MQEQMETMANQQKRQRRTLQKSRPRSTYSSKKTKKNIAGRVASTLRRRRSKLSYMYQNALIEIAESKLNLPHEGRKGLLYAVPDIPKGYTRQSLIDIFDEVIENMIKSGGPLKFEPPQGHLISPIPMSPQSSSDLLTGDINSPEDYGCYLVLPSLIPNPTPACSSASLIAQRELSELDWSPATPKDGLLIDLRLDSPMLSPQTPTKSQHWFGHELFLDNSNRKASAPPSPNTSTPSLEISHWPEPLQFHDSPFPTIASTKISRGVQSASTETPFKGLTRKAPSGDLRMTNTKPKLQISPPSPTSILMKSSRTVIPRCLQPGPRISRKPVPKTPTSLQPVLRSDYLPPSPSSSAHSPTLPEILSASSTSLLDELNGELDRLLADINPSTETLGASKSRKPKEELTPEPLKKQDTGTKATTTPPPLPGLLQPGPHSRSHILPQSHRIPTRTSSRTTTAATTTTTTQANFAAPAAGPSSTPAPSFRNRLGKSTLTALLAASSTPEFEALWEDAKRTRPGSDADCPRAFGWRRWVDQDWDESGR